MRIGICDDQKMAVDILESMINECLKNSPLQVEIFCFYSGKELLESRQELDLLFLDIDMPEIDGIETGIEYRKRNHACKIIMETSMVERMREAFYVEAYRFLTKPIQAHELEEVFASFQKSCIGNDTISLMDNRRCVEVMQKEISYVQSYDSYTEFIVKNRILRSEKSLRMLEEELDQRLFFRVTKKYIVNLGYISAYRNGVIKIEDKKIAVSRRRKKEFEALYLTYDLEYR